MVNITFSVLSILVNYYFQVSFNLKAILYAAKTPWLRGSTTYTIILS